MKKTMGYIVSWVLYYFGHWTSKVMDWTDAFWLYEIYNCFMVKSSYIQDWSGIISGPWRVEGESS